MRLKFNDGTSISIQKAEEIAGKFRVLTIECPPDQLRELFSDPVKTGCMEVVDREEKLGRYEGYTEFYRTEEYPGKIYGVAMTQVGKSAEERLSKAEKTIEKTSAEFNLAVAELSMLIASIMKGGGGSGV